MEPNSKEHSINRRSLMRWYTVMMVAVNLASLIIFYFSFDNLEVPFHELPNLVRNITLVGFSLITLSTISSISWLVLLLIENGWAGKLTDAFVTNISRPRVFLIIATLLFLLGVFSGQILLLNQGTENLPVSLYIRLIQPVFVWLSSFAVINLFFLLIITGFLRKFSARGIINPAFLAFSLLILLILLNASDYGFQHRSVEAGNFRLTGFPIVGYQLFFSWVGVVGGTVLLRWIYQKWGNSIEIPQRLADIFIFTALIVGAFIISNSAPVNPDAFIDRPRPPNYSITPNLDAELYERTAQSLLTMGKMQSYLGQGDYLSIARRPLYALYLAFLHWIGGPGYEDILTLQLMFFALIPGLVYLFTKTLHNRISGILTAILIIIRHQNGLWLSADVWGGTTLHMLMSDFPAMMIVILVLITSTVWIKNPRDKSLYPLIIGGLIGLGLLIRQEILILLPIIGLAAFIILRDRFKFLMGQLLLLLFGALVVITPWVNRNWVNTGKLYIEQQDSRVENIIENIKNRVADYDQNHQNITIDHTEEGTLESDSDDELTNQPEISSQSNLELIINHYANAVQQLFLYLPSNSMVLDLDNLRMLSWGKPDRFVDGIFSPSKYGKSLPYWGWDKWDGKIDQKSWLFLIGNVGLFSLGVYRVWKKQHWVTAVPLLAIFGFISIHAVVRSSGGRWLLSIDWLTAMFLVIGLVELTFLIINGLVIPENGNDSFPETDFIRERVNQFPDNRMILLFFLGIVLLGSLPVLAEIVLPNHYSESDQNYYLTALLGDETKQLNQDDQDFVASFLDQGGEVIYGRALYPRYFPPDAELMTSNQTLFPSSTTFTIAGTELNFVVLPRLAPTILFPHASDVLVFGCREVSFPPDPGFPCLGCFTDGFDALAVILLDEDIQGEDILWRDGARGNTGGCPLTWPGD